MCFGYGYPMQSLRRALGAFTRKCGAFLQLGLTLYLQLYQFCAVNPEVFSKAMWPRSSRVLQAANTTPPPFRGWVCVLFAAAAAIEFFIGLFGIFSAAKYTLRIKDLRKSYALPSRKGNLQRPVVGRCSA
jgi:hypothetical protein